MTTSYQLDLFKNPDICRLEAELAATRESGHKVRKGTYKRLNELQKLYNELNDEFTHIKRAICRSKNIIDINDQVAI